MSDPIVETTMTTRRAIMTEEMVVETTGTEAIIATDMNDAMVAMTMRIKSSPTSKVHQESCASCADVRHMAHIFKCSRQINHRLYFPMFNLLSKTSK